MHNPASKNKHLPLHFHRFGNSHTRSEKVGLRDILLGKYGFPAHYLVSLPKLLGLLLWLLPGIILYGIPFGSIVDFSIIISLWNV